MKLTDIFIHRPVFATVINLIVLLTGLIAYQKLPVREFPRIESSIVNITTTYPGADAQLMEGFVTTPIEGALASLDGVDYIESNNQQGFSSINIFFHHGYDIDKAISEVSSRVASVRRKLPRDIDDPIIAKQDPNSQPVMYLPFISHKMSAQEISDYLLRVIQPQLEVLPGVGEARILGERRYAMRIWLDPNLLAAHNVTADEVAQALAANNVQTTAGLLSNGLQEFNVTATTDLATEEEFNNLVIKDKNGQLIRIRDVGYAELGSANNRFSVIMDGQSSVVIGIVPKSDANPLSVANEVNAALLRLQENMPEDLTAKVMWDSTRFIDASIYEVKKTLIEAVIFVIIIIFLFLGSVRAITIPLVTIPLSLIGVCIIMFALGYSLNTLTFLAWVLAIGMVVDDAIVVLENIHRNLEKGMSAKEAALIGAREIRFAVIAMTLTLVAVYAPIGFMGGVTGTLFREFAFTLAGAVLISGFVALTLSPMMCSKLLVHHNAESKLAQTIGHYLEWCKDRYYTSLNKVLDRKKLFVVIAAIIYLACFALYKILNQELAPPEDQSVIVTFASGPTSSNLQFTEKYTEQLIPIFNSIPEILNYGIINGFGSSVGVNSAISFAVTKPWSERKRSINEIISEMMPKVWAIPGIKAFPVSPPALPIGSFTPVEFVLQTTGSYTELDQAMQSMLLAAYQNPGLMFVDTNLKLTNPQVNLWIDRNKAADLGISMEAIGRTLSVFLSEPAISHFVINGRNYDVISQLSPEYRTTRDKLENLHVRTNSGELIPLSNIVKVQEEVVPPSLAHFQQLRSGTLKAALAPGYTLGQALTYLETKAKELLPDNIQFDYGGESRQFKRTGAEIYLVFIYALLFIYLVLAAQFESFRSPLIIMISVPLCFTGALLAMYLTGATLNIYTQIGLVTLIGLITKHGILIVEFANQLQTQGKSKQEALLEACALRLRPILMTTGAMILAAIPLAFASGAGAESRHQLGWTIVGGMTLGTLFTLFIVPVGYLYLGKDYNKEKST